MKFALPLLPALLFFLSSSHVRAETELFPFTHTSICHPRSAIQPRECQNNGILVQAAVACHELVKTESKNVKAKLDAMNAAYRKQLQAKGMNEQDVHFKAAEYAYSTSQAATEYLYKVTDMSTKEVYEYQDFLWPPEDYDSPQITRGSQEHFLMVANPCYGERKLSLDEIKAAFDQEKLNLMKTKATAFQKEGFSAGHRTDLTSLSENAAKAKAQGSAAPVPKGTTPKTASDITGAKKSIDDAAKAKALLQQRPKK